MQNIQDLKEKIFFESKNIIDILDKINNVDELLSKQDLVDELANRISFLRLLEKNIEYFIQDPHGKISENQVYISSGNSGTEANESNHEVTEEEAIFNNEFNEIDENSEGIQEEFSSTIEEEAVFNNKLNEIVENEFHENIVSFAEEMEQSGPVQEKSSYDQTTEEAVFNNQINQMADDEVSEDQIPVLSFVDEERILANAEPESDDDFTEGIFRHTLSEEEVIFNNQLNEIDEFENEISDDEGNNLKDFEEEETIQKSFEPEAKENEEKIEIHQKSEPTERIPSIFDTDSFEEDEILVEENEEQFIAPNMTIEQGEMATDTSNVENILAEIKHDSSPHEKEEEVPLAEPTDRRKIVEINKPLSENENDRHASDESFENLDEYHMERKIKLANIKGLKAVQTLFDDDPLDRGTPQERPKHASQEDAGGILKTNIPTGFMEAEKQKPEFKLDLNDRIAFTKMLFNGSQTDLNDTIDYLNQFKTLKDAKEYLSDLYYDRKWNKVDEYAQRLWVLVENKFL